ncbi:MAG TPA: hypothetical protein VFQ65_06875 [Kofleriaceae bacterium]|nr:hypothetical protein [Kofleriaceae bacterium]
MDRQHVIGRLCIGGDWACAHGDFAALRAIAQRLADQVSEPLHCELVALAEACRGDLDRATVMWERLKDCVYQTA